MAFSLDKKLRLIIIIAISLLFFIAEITGAHALFPAHVINT